MSLALRPLRFEQLEDKRLLAGDVTVSVVEGALVITGDEEGNQIAISSGDEAGEFVIEGLDGTLLHLAGEDGAGQSELVVNGVRGIHVALGEGDDAVSITDARVRGNVVIHMGDGDDTVEVGLGDTLPEETLTVAAVAEGGVAIGGSLIIRTGADDDTVRLGGQQSETPELVESEDEAVRSLRIGNTLITGLGDGEDEFTLDSVAARYAMVVNGGQGGDSIDLARARTKVLTLLGGGGEFGDSIRLQDVYAHVATIGTGQGADNVEIVDSAFSILGVRLAGGDDTLSIGNTRARLAVLVGGEGSADTYNDLGGNEFGRLIKLGFELPEDDAEPEVTVVAEPAQAVVGQIVSAGQGLLSRLAGRLRGR